MKNQLALYVFCILFIFVVNSCITDVPQQEKQFNTRNTYVPPVINFHYNDSIIKLIEIDTVDVNLRSSSNYLVRRIASSDYHLGFPDLIKFEDMWYISLRLSEGHMPVTFGYAVLLKSKDLKVWELEQIFTQEGYDIRDPKLFESDSILYLHFNSTTINPYGEIRNDYISRYNTNTKLWEEAKKINKNTFQKSWFWRITPYKGVFYTAGYSKGQLSLYKSDNSISFHEIYHFSFADNLYEATLRFFENNAYILVRVSKDNTLIGVAREDDLTNWTFNSLPIIEIGGPNFLIYRDNIILSGRNINKTSIYYYNITSNKLKELNIILPSDSDTGYPGMYIEDDILYLLYYSAGNPLSKTSVNLAVIELNKTSLSFD